MTLRRVAAAVAMTGAVCAFTSTALAADPTRDDSRNFYDVIGEDDPRPANYDFSFLSIAANQNWPLTRWSGGGIYFGVGGGAGTPLYRVSKMEDRDIGIDPTIEILFANTYFRIAPFRYLDLDLGGRIALGASVFDVSDPPRAGFISGGYADLRVGSKKIKFGPRFEYDRIVFDRFTETGWKITPLMLRVAM